MSSKEVDTSRISTNGHKNEEMIPGLVEVPVPGFTVADPVNDGVKKSGMSKFIENLHEQGKHIVAVKRPGKMAFYVGSSLALIGTIAGGIYLSNKKRRGDG